MAGWFRKYLPGGTQNPKSASLQPQQQVATTGEFKFTDEELRDFYASKGFTPSQAQIDYIKANTMKGYYVKATEVPERSNSYIDMLNSMEEKTMMIYD